MTRAEQLEYLIRYLAPAVTMPEDQEEKWLLLRALMNIREPAPIGRDFLAVQDDFLQREIAGKGITDITQLAPVQGTMYLWQGDITTLRADAVVNAANSGLTGCYCPLHGCIDNAIHTYAGVQLRLACADIMERQGYPEPPGRAKITAAYNLPSRYILHTVGPFVKGSPTGEACNQLRSCYRACLELAEASGCRSLAFCCISTGEYHFPPGMAAEIAVDTVRTFLKHHCLRVVFNVFKDEDRGIYHKLLSA